MKQLIILASASVFTASVAAYIAFDYGTSRERAKCLQGLHALQTTVNKLNTEAIKLSERQKQSYRLALEVRDTDYRRIDKELSINLKTIEELKRESEDTCVNRRIPDGFK